MKSKILVVLLIAAQSVFAQEASFQDKVSQAEADVKKMNQMVEQVGMTMDDSEGLLSALGQNSTQAEILLKRMQQDQDHADEISIEIKELLKNSKEIMSK